MNTNSIIFFKLLMVLIAVSFITAAPDTSTPEKYGKELIKVLRKGEVKYFKKFCGTCEEFKKSYLKAITDSATKVGFLKEYTKEKCKAEFERNYSRFEEVITSGKVKGIDWNKINYRGVEYKITTGDHGIHAIYKLKVIFLFENQEYYVEIKGLGKFGNSWKGGKIYGPRNVLMLRDK